MDFLLLMLPYKVTPITTTTMWL